MKSRFILSVSLVAGVVSAMLASVGPALAQVSSGLLPIRNGAQQEDGYTAPERIGLLPSGRFSSADEETAPAIPQAIPRTSSPAAPQAVSEPEQHPEEGASSTTAPQVQISQHLPAEVRAGEPVDVAIVVANTGSVPVDGVVVKDTVRSDVQVVDCDPQPSRSADTLEWSLGRLDAGAEATIRMTVVYQATSQAATVENTATVRFEASVTRVAKVARPEILVAVNGPDTAIVGTPITFSITVANVGKAEANNVLLQNDLPAALTHPYGPQLENQIGKLKAGQTRKVNLTVTPVKPGPVINSIVVTADHLSPVQHNAAVVVEQVQLVLTASGPKRRYSGRACSYEYTIENQSEVAATGVALQSKLPRGIAYADSSGAGAYDAVAHAVHWELGDVGPGQRRTVVVNATAAEIGLQKVEATLSSTVGSKEQAEIETEVRGISALDLDVSDTVDLLEVGGECVYEIRIVNKGTTAATNIAVVATIPQEVEVTGAAGPTAQSVVDDTLTFVPVEKLAPNEDVMYRIKVVGRKPGNCRLRVAMMSDQFSQPIIEEESTTVFTDE